MYAGVEKRWREAGSGVLAMASGSTQYSALPAPVAGAVASEPDALEYPGRHWIAQSLWHGDAVAQARTALRQHFRKRDDVLVAMELAVYFEHGDEETWLQPDVLVVFGVERGRERSSYKVWEEGKAPDFVLEVASPSTADRDALDKARKYASIGVLEYWRLDPQGTILEAPLEGYRAKGHRYRWVEEVEGTGGVGYLRSRVLGLDLRAESRNGATVLVIRDPETGEEFDGALEGPERRRRLAEDRASVAEDRAKVAKEQLTAAEDRASAARDEARASKDEARAAKDRASVAEKRTQVLEQQLRDLTGQARLERRNP